MNTKNKISTSYVAASLLSIMLVLLVTTPVFAHQQKASMTTIAYNSNTNRVEIIHRFLLHDAEHAVKVLFDKDADIYHSAQTQRLFSSYIRKNFALLDKSNRPIPVSNVGHEADGKHFWVYQETSSGIHDIYQIRHSALHEVWASQVNTINVEFESSVRSLSITKERPAQKLTALSLQLPPMQEQLFTK